jgi:uncharacterized protein
VVGFAKGKGKATNKPFEDHWIFAITVRDGKLTSIREYVDTQALARASEADEDLTHSPSDSGAAQRAS